MSSDTRWKLARSALGETSLRFGKLLRSVSDTTARAVGQWSIAETAAHVAGVCQADATFALGDDSAPELQDLVERAATARVDDMAELNAVGLEREPERDVHVLAARIEKRVDQLLDATTGANGNEPVRWIADVDLPIGGVLAHLVSELLVHGYDIARAEGRRWDIPREYARLVYEAFFLEFLRNGGAQRFLAQTGRGVGDVSCEFRVRGAERALFVYKDGRLALAGTGSHSADLRIAADPTTMLLVIYRRMSPVLPAVRGQLAVWGRRPWRLRRLMRVLQTP